MKETILQHIQKTYKGGNDIARSLEDLKVFNLKDEKPKREISKEEIPSEAAIEQAGMDITYQEELRRFLDRQDNLRENMYKAYALIYTNYCTRAMQSRVETHPDFDNKIKNDPIALLEVIKILMHDTVRAQYPMVSMTEALTRLVNVKQFDNEPLLDYVK